MAINSTFDIQPDQITFTARCNGDRIEIKHVDLDAENAANLATLINSGEILEIKIREKP